MNCTVYVIFGACSCELTSLISANHKPSCFFQHSNDTGKCMTRNLMLFQQIEFSIFLGYLAFQTLWKKKLIYVRFMYPPPFGNLPLSEPLPLRISLTLCMGYGYFLESQNSCLIFQTIVNLAHNCVNAVGIKIYMKAMLVQFNSICHGKDAIWNCENNL